MRSPVTKAAILCLAIAGMAIVTLSHADNMRVTNLGAYSSLNMRSGPGVGYRVVTSIPSGANYINWTCATRRVGNSTWYQIDWHGYSGWASSRYLRYMRGSHRHCSTTSGGSTGGWSDGSGQGHVHSHATHHHSHRHGSITHSHAHSHNDHASHNASSHGGGGHTSSSGNSSCQVLNLGGLKVRIC